MDGVSSWMLELHLPNAAGYVTPFFRLPSLSALEMNLLERAYLIGTSRKHFIDSVPTITMAIFYNEGEHLSTLNISIKTKL